jgi:hypothetical protein
MAYIPPVGTADLELTGSYTPPVGTANLIIGWNPSLNRTVVLAGETLAPTGSIQALKVIQFAVTGETLAPIGNLNSTWDPNLLSAVHAVVDTAWQDGRNESQGLQEALGDAPDVRWGASSLWQDAALLDASQRPGWQDSLHLDSAGADRWQDADSVRTTVIEGWQQSPRLERDTADRWQDAAELPTPPVIGRFRVRIPLLAHDALPVWQHSETLTHPIRDGMQDGLRLIAVEIEIWQQAGYPYNAPNPGPAIPVPVPVPWPWGTALNLRCPLPGTTLRIGRSPCILVAEREIPIRKTYMTVNSASLVRWPDLTPVPVVEMSVETDFDSWCWALTATLAGADAWALVQPNPLACEVQATINNQVWRFLLDVPSNNRSFNYNRVTLRGRSRSAWLHEPYAPVQDFSQANAREMVQLAEAALYNTGWTIDWDLDNWVVPAGHYTSWNTPIAELIKLVTATDDGLYTDPDLQVITAQKRWPVASWLVDGETADLLIPEDAVISLTQSPLYSQPYNGVYVSGTLYGALALVKISGTDGALQPTEPLVNALLCDGAGVAARARGLNLLSNSGAGWTMDADVLFTPEIGLVKPGMIVNIASLKGISRSCKIQCSWNDGGLVVKQTVGLERREVEQS